MPFYLLTFRPQPSEYTLLDTFYTIIKPQLDDNKNILQYAIVVEKDNTIDRHCHTLVEFKETKSKGNQLKSFYNKQVFKDFKLMLKNVLTNPIWGFDDKQVKDTREDYLYTLGYIFKEIQCHRRHYTIPEEDCVEAIEYYYQMRKIDKSKPSENDLRVMTSKNIHINVYDFCKKNELRPRDKEKVQLSMIKSGYMFSQVRIKNTFEELDIHMNPDDYDDDEIPEPKEYTHLIDELKYMKSKLDMYNTLFKKLEHMTEPMNNNLQVPASEVYKIVKKREYIFESDSEDE